MKYVLHLAARQLPDPSCGGLLNSGLFLPASAPHCGYWAGVWWGPHTVLRTGDPEIRDSVNINKSFTHDLMEQQIRGLGTRH